MSDDGGRRTADRRGSRIEDRGSRLAARRSRSDPRASTFEPRASSLEPPATRCQILAEVDPKFVDRVDLVAIERAAEATLEHEGIGGPAEISLLVRDDAAIRELNRHYLGRDRPTDVLSFPLTGPGATPREAGVDAEAAAEVDFPSAPDDVRRLGDVVISYDRAAAQAQEYGHGAERELLLLFVHGLLHLLGHVDYTDADRQAMHRRAEEILEQLTRRA